MSQGDVRGTDVLIVGAHLPDLAGTHPWLGDKLQGAVRGLHVRTKVVGAGGPVAAAGTARGILALSPRVVVLVGTCGVYPGAAERRPLDLVVPSHAGLLCHAVLAQRAAFPGPLQTTVDCDALVGSSLAACHPRGLLAPVASPLADTTDDALAASVHPVTAFVAENLELFGVASACRAADVPFVGALGVTHVVGRSGRRDWSTFQHDAVTAVASAVVGWLNKGAPGLRHG
jgi:nucleoside phosphorylase